MSFNNNLQDTVQEVVDDFMLNNMLFTALDVSNAVKQVMPSARHRQVRDVVRSMFTTHIEPKGWARTPITVVLSDGSTAEALLYHPLVDSWDLDSKYDDQKRNATSKKPQLSTVPAPVPTVAVSLPVQPDPLSALSDVLKASSANDTSASTVKTTTPEPPLTVWEKLCNMHKSFFSNE